MAVSWVVPHGLIGRYLRLNGWFLKMETAGYAETQVSAHES